MDDGLTMLRPVTPQPDQYEYTMDPMENGMFPPSAEDAAHKLEASVLGGLWQHSHDRNQEAVKRRVGGAESEGHSDIEMPSGLRQDYSGHPTKKRMLDRDAADTADEVERSITGELYSVSPDKPGLSARAKGKAKQILLRGDTPESVSAAPKAPRKRLGPRKKLDHLHPETLELLGFGSGPPSVSGDITPNVSRPASPALTATSNVVYELDELVPPLKRAKKVDDIAMLKRVKALEEAQRKVWTNIAKRDVAKVRPVIFL